MHCAGCSSRVQQALEQTPGVRAANVNLMTGSATIDFDPSLIGPEGLVDVIRDTGYEAELPAGVSVEETLDQEDAARAAEIATLRRKFWVSLVAAVLAMLFSLPLTATGPGSMGDPFMRLMMPLSRGLRSLAPWTAAVSADT